MASTTKRQIEFTLLSFQLTQDFVVMLDDMDNPGTTVSEPIIAIGLARVRRFDVSSGESWDQARKDGYCENEMVGIQLGDDGEFYIVNESLNFMGICRKGQESGFNCKLQEVPA